MGSREQVISPHPSPLASVGRGAGRPTHRMRTALRAKTGHTDLHAPHDGVQDDRHLHLLAHQHLQAGQGLLRLAQQELGLRVRGGGAGRRHLLLRQQVGAGGGRRLREATGARGGQGSDRGGIYGARGHTCRTCTK